MSSDPTRVIYVAGVGRSGSTLLDLALPSLHNGLFTVGEAMALLHASHITRSDACRCRLPIARCPFWTRVFDDTFGAEATEAGLARTDRWMAVALRRRAQIAALARRPQPLPSPLARTLSAFYGAIRAASGCEAIVDASKHPMFGFQLLAAPGIDLSVIQLVRDPRAVSFSWRRPKPRPSGAPMPVRPHGRVAAEWLLHNAIATRLRRAARRSVLVRYEDLAADPRAVMGDLLARIDLPCPPAPPGPLRLAPAGHSVAGNPLRFGPLEITVRPDAEWRERLPRRHKALVAAIASPLLGRFGYR